MKLGTSHIQETKAKLGPKRLIGKVHQSTIALVCAVAAFKFGFHALGVDLSTHLQDENFSLPGA